MVTFIPVLALIFILFLKRDSSDLPSGYRALYFIAKNSVLKLSDKERYIFSAVSIGFMKFFLKKFMPLYPFPKRSCINVNRSFTSCLKKRSLNFFCASTASTFKAPGTYCTTVPCGNPFLRSSLNCDLVLETPSTIKVLPFVDWRYSSLAGSCSMERALSITIVEPIPFLSLPIIVDASALSDFLFSSIFFVSSLRASFPFLSNSINLSRIASSSTTPKSLHLPRYFSFMASISSAIAFVILDFLTLSLPLGSFI